MTTEHAAAAALRAYATYNASRSLDDLAAYAAAEGEWQHLRNVELAARHITYWASEAAHATDDDDRAVCMAELAAAQYRLAALTTI